MTNNPQMAKPNYLNRVRTIAYWLFTILVSFEMVAGSIWDLLKIEYVRTVLSQLGYPIYVCIVIGVWKFPCALTLMMPRFQRLKEWAYAGAFFNYWGAFLSHILVGGGTKRVIAPLILAIFTLASWALRPPSRRLEPASAAVTNVREWVAPAIALAVMAAVSFLTMPKGPPAA